MNERWEAVRRERIAEIDTLPLSKALLALIRIINQAGQYANINQVEAVATGGRSLGPDVRLFRSFGTLPDSDNGVSHADAKEFRLKVADSSCYIQQQGYVVGIGRWRITESGEKTLDDYIEEKGMLPIDTNEAAAVMELLQPQLRQNAQSEQLA
ncbi:MAG: hypothetical protein F4X83_00175 [Chloroflexi bacterium]|nr:hypothetical protein [Chloroflexota bacterium]